MGTDRTYAPAASGLSVRRRCCAYSLKSIIRQRRERGESIQPVFMACGTEDFLLENNRSFYEFLKKEGIEVDYHESTGTHDWKFWNEYLEPAVKWMLQ